MTAILLLNWNGASETLACLQSLVDAKGDFFVVVADNASTDDSLKQIQTFASNCTAISIKVLPLDKNYGFAEGNNKAVKYANQFTPDSYMLLNNDTEVAADFLQQLVSFSRLHPQYRALSPVITYYDNKDLIWNCGGCLRWGRRKNLYAGKTYDALNGQAYFPVQFISGCGLFFFPELLDAEGRIFTNRFFFGEEDFELSIRLNKQKVPLACVCSSRVYHKVGQSRKQIDYYKHVGPYYMYYWACLMCYRWHYPKWKFLLLEMAYMPFAWYRFYRIQGSLRQSLNLLKQLRFEVRNKGEITVEDFKKLIVDNTYFN